jgi:hypothetical protein
MRLAILYRLAIPLLLALASATVFFRMLLLLVLALAFAGLVVMVTRMTGNRVGRDRKQAGNGKKIIDSSYKIVDENEDASK